MPNIAPENTQVISLIAAFNQVHELLLLKRPESVQQGGLWSFPGGKVENDEMPLQAAVREFKEETGLKGTLWRHLGKSSHVYSGKTLNFLIFVCFCPDISNFTPESTAKWVSLNNLNDYAMPKANKELIDMLFMDEVDEYLTALNSK
ncbi:MAG: NUDIX domain-containing protein [Mariprofundaceae bacterium]|nr:NUDIX domain-containing protein [Mariprofundaceae bacterium]